MRIFFPVPILLYTLAALMVLVFSRRAGSLKAVLVASYCGVSITSFTGGSSGGIWLGPVFLLLLGPIVLLGHKKRPQLGSVRMVKFTHALFIIYIIGIFVGLLRYDPILEVEKAGAFTTLFGIPVRYLMVIYRIQTVAFVFLAFTLPQRYHIDKPLFLQCLRLCWFFTIVLAVGGILNYIGAADLTFSRYVGVPGAPTLIVGFSKTNFALIMITGLLVSFAISQLTQSYILKALAAASIPLFVMALLLSQSRSSVVALIASGLFLVFVLRGTRLFKGILVALGSVITVYVVMMWFPEVRERLGFLEIFYSTSPQPLRAVEVGQTRISNWTNLLKWLVVSPGILAFGAGFQNYHYFIHLHAGTVGLSTAHNNYLTILAESGIVGLSVFIGWFVSIFYWLRSWQRTVIDRTDKLIPGIFMLLMVAVMAACLTGEILAPTVGVVSWVVIFYLMLGIWISYYRTQMMELSSMWEAEYYNNYEQDPLQPPAPCPQS